MNTVKKFFTVFLDKNLRIYLATIYEKFFQKCARVARASISSCRSLLQFVKHF